MANTIKEDICCYASTAQKEVLNAIITINLLRENFFLTGGTALSIFFLHHRTSEDLDFFTTTFKELSKIDFDLKRRFKDDLALIQSSPDFYSYLIKGVKVDIVFDLYKMLSWT